jgi:hypothetical protein
MAVVAKGAESRPEVAGGLVVDVVALVVGVAPRVVGGAAPDVVVTASVDVVVGSTTVVEDASAVFPAWGSLSLEHAPAARATTRTPACRFHRMTASLPTALLPVAHPGSRSS